MKSVEKIRAPESEMTLLTDLLSQFLGLGLLQLGDLGQGFAAVDSTSPMTTDLLEAVVEVVFRGLDDFAQSTFVLRVDVG